MDLFEELINSLDKMWEIFIKIADIKNGKEIENYIEEKDKAHDLIVKIYRLKEGGC